jgi:hypothetical protein
MTTPAQHDTRIPPAPSRLSALRGNCMGAAVLLIVQFGLGMGVNLYVTLPAGKSFLSTVFGSGHPRPPGGRVHLGWPGRDRRRRDRRGVVRRQPGQRRLARHGPGHRGGHVLLPGRGLQPPLTAWRTPNTSRSAVRCGEFAAAASS